MERELIVERTKKAGLDAAKKLERVGGRKISMTDSKLASAKKLLATEHIQKMRQKIWEFQLLHSTGGSPQRNFS